MSLLHWWPLNETLADQGSGHTALTLGTGSTSYEAGKIGKALKCSSSYWQLNSMTCGTDLTICAWAKTSGTGAMLWGIQCSASDYMNLYMSSPISLNVGDDAHNPFQDASGNTTQPYSDGLWHHYAVVFKGSENAKLYIDGSYKGTAKTYRNPTMNNKIFTLATWNYSSHGYYWNGDINDVRIYDEALSASAIHEIAQGLVLHYPLNGNGTSVGVPSEYQRVEYIESTGTQYLTTSLQVKDVDRMVVTLMPTINTVTEMAWSGSYATSGYKIWMNFYSTGQTAFGENTGVSGTRFAYTMNEQHIFDIYLPSAIGKRSEIKYDGVLKWYYTTTIACTQTYAIHLFKANGSYTGYNYFGGRCYDCKMYDSNERISFHGIPCYRKSDGVAGMYDTVSNTFLTNSGTGEFLLGPSIGLPREYQEVEYLESTGVQGFHLNTYSKSNLSLRGIVAFTKNSLSNQYFGCMNGCYIGAIGDKWELGGTASSKAIVIGQQYKYNAVWTTVDGSISSTATLTIDGTQAMTLSRAYTNNQQLNAFGLELNASYVCWLRQYNYQVLNNNTVIADLIPCYRRIDGKPGMYDVINNIFYVNQGSGVDFMIGPSRGIPSRYRQCEYIQGVESSTSSLQYINSGISNYNSQTDEINFICKVTESGSAAAQPLFGARKDSYPDSSFWIGLNNKYYIPMGSDMYSTNYGLGNLANFRRLKGGIGYINEEHVGTLANTSDTGNILVMIGASSGTDATPDFRHTYTIQAYAARIWKGGTILDLVPAYDTITSTYGMYDICSGKFLTNSGSGSFTAGNFVGHEQIVMDPWGKELDISGYHRDGTRVGTYYPSESTLRYDKSIAFPSGANYIWSDSGSFTWFPFTSGTVSVWFKPLTVPSNWASTCGITTVNSCNSGLALSNYSGKFTAHIPTTSSSWGLTISDVSLASGTWYHLAVTLNGTTAKMYCNGSCIKTFTTTVAPTVGSDTRAVVNNDIGGSPEYATCEVSDMKVFATALSDTDVLSLYNQRNDN